jgi:hypothetical protein
MGEEVFFERNYARAKNWDRAVGVDADHVLILERIQGTDQYETRPFHCTEVSRIHVKQYRSAYVFVLALVLLLFGLAAAYVAVSGALVGVGVYVAPPILLYMSYLAFTHTRVIKITFDGLSKTYTYKCWPMDFEETRASVTGLCAWAKSNRIPVVLNLPADKA